MSEKLRAGVIGLGAMGANHARVYGEMPAFWAPGSQLNRRLDRRTMSR